MVFEAITDRLRNRGLLNKEPTAVSDDILTSGSEEAIEDIADYQPQPLPEMRDEEMEPSMLRASQDSLKNITSPKLSDVIKSRDITPVDETLEPYSKTELSQFPTSEEELLPLIPEPKVTPKIPETPVETPKMPETPESPKMPETPEPETTITDELTKEVKPSGPSLTDVIKSKFKTAAEYKKTLGENLGGPSLTDRDYALHGDYKGDYTGEELTIKISSLKSRRDQVLADIESVDKELAERREEAKEISDKLRGTRDIAERSQYNSELKRINDEIRRLDDKRDSHIKRASGYEEQILNHRRQLNEYNAAVRRGRMKASTRAKIGKKLQALGEGPELITAGVYGRKTMTNQDWFGPKGFLDQPYKKSNITGNVVQPVRPRLANLDAITRSTGAIVGHGMVDAVTTVRANRNITPFGAPGTIQGARKQFDYNIPAKKILPGDVTTNINRDILPSIFAPIKPEPVALSPMQYQQVVQPDGTIINVPIQQRKQKYFSVSLKRFTHKASPKVSVKPVGSRLERGIASVGNLKPMDIDIGGKRNFTLGLVTVKNMNINGTIKRPEEVEPSKEFRKSKKQKPLVNLDSAAVISKNLNKLLSKKNKSK